MRARLQVRLCLSPRSGRHCNRMGREPHERERERGDPIHAAARGVGGIAIAWGVRPMRAAMRSTIASPRFKRSSWGFCIGTGLNLTSANLWD